MRLKPNLPLTPFDFPRGADLEAIPNTGDRNRPASSVWWSKSQLLTHPANIYSDGAIFLGRVDQTMIGRLDNRHIVTVAGTRAGKSVCLLIPNLMLYEGSALVLDPKGELATATAQYRHDVLKQRVHILDPFGAVSREGIDSDLFVNFDPLDELRCKLASGLAGEQDLLIENADLIADALIIRAEGSENSFWTDSARALVRALILWLVLDPENSGGSLSRIPKILEQIAGEKQGDGESLLEKLASFDPEDVEEEQRAAWSIVKGQAEFMSGLHDRERSNILATVRAQLVFLDSPAMARSVSESAFALADLKASPSTVYLCLPASRLGTHSRWLRLIVNLSLAALENTPTPKDRPPVLFVLEEFAALGHMRPLENAVAYMAGFGVKLWAVLQDITQLKRHYKESWETFLGNAGILQAFSIADMSTLEYLSKRLGETTFAITNKVKVGSSGAAGGDDGQRREFKTAPLLLPDELAIKFARKDDDKGNGIGGLTLVLVSGKRPFVCDRVFYRELEA